MNEPRVDKVLVTNVTGANTGTSLATIVDGDVLVLNNSMGNMTGTPTPSSAPNQESIYIALGDASRDETFILSSEIIAKNVTGWRKQAYQAAVQAFGYAGYNATSGTLALEDATEYRLRIDIPERHQMRPHLKTQFDYYYTTPASADQFDAAAAFAKKVNADNRGIRATFQAEVASNGTLTEFGATADPTLTQDDETVTFAAVHGRSVGDIIAFTETASGRLDVFKVVTVNSTTSLELDRKWNHATRTIDVSATTDEAVIVTATTSWGLRINAVAVTQRTYGNTLPLDNYQQIDFTFSLAPINGAAGDEETITMTPAVPGIGTGASVRDLEFRAAAGLGYTNRTQHPVSAIPLNAVVANQYDLYVIDHYNEVWTGNGVYRDPITTVIAFKSDVTTKMDAIEAILDAWMVGAGLPAIA